MIDVLHIARACGDKDNAREASSVTLGARVTAVFVAWINATPTYELSILPHVPLEPLLVTVGFGIVLVLLYQRVTADLSLAVMIGMTYSALVWGPFIYLG